MNPLHAAQHYFTASRWARDRAEYWREQGDYTGAAQEARAEARYHIKMREKARDYASQAKAVKP